MKLSRYATYKNKGSTEIANQELRPGIRLADGVPAWYPGSDVLLVRVKGVEGRPEDKPTYHYDLRLSGAELALIVETALAGCSEGQTAQTLAKAVGAFVREALAAKHNAESDAKGVQH